MAIVFWAPIIPTNIAELITALTDDVCLSLKISNKGLAFRATPIFKCLS